MRKNLKTLTGQVHEKANDIFSGIASSRRQDRDGETIDQGGWIMDDYVKNPVLLFGHNPHVPPVGKTFNHRQTDRGLEFDFAFAPSSFGQELRSLVREGFLNTFSVGFIPRGFGKEQAGEATYTQAELLEISLVSIPSNPDALVTSRSWEGVSEKTKRFVLGEIYGHKSVVNHKATKFPKVEDYAWDEDAERRKAQIDDLKVMATWVNDEAPNDRGSYTLLHHTSSKDFPVVKEALDDAMKNLSLVPEEDREAASQHLVKHYEELGLEVPETKAPAQEEHTEKAVTVELADEDRKLLKRVADALETSKAQEIEQPVKGRPLRKNADQNEIMVLALQKVSKLVNKELCKRKKQRYGKKGN